MKCILVLISFVVLALGQNTSVTPTPTITSPEPPITTTPTPPTTPAPTTSTSTPTTTPPPVTTTTTLAPVTTPPVTTTLAPVTTTAPVTTAPPTMTASTTTTSPLATTSPPATTSLRPGSTNPPVSTTEAPVTTTTPPTPTATTNSTNDVVATSAAPTAKPTDSPSNSNVIWIILGSVVGALVVGVGFVFLLRRSKKDEGHDDDVISNYGGNVSSPHIAYKSTLSTSHLLRNIPPVVSPTTPIVDSPLVAGVPNFLPDDEQYLSDLDIPRHSSPSSAGDVSRRANAGPTSPNLWQSAITSSPQGASKMFQSSVFHSNLSDSYSIRPSDSSDGHLSDSFASKQSTSVDGPFRCSHAL